MPAGSFDPGVEAVVRFAAGLARSRRSVSGALLAPACAVRVRLDADESGRLRYTVELPAHAKHALATAAGAYADGVELREVPLDPAARRTASPVARRPRSPAPSWCWRGRATSRCARSGLDPDPARRLRPRPRRACGRSAASGRPSASTCCRSRPPGRRRARRSAAAPRAAPAARRARTGIGARDVRRRLRSRPQPAGRAGRPPGRPERPAQQARPLRADVLPAGPGPHFLARSRRGQLRLEGILAAFDGFAGENHFRVAGLNLGGAVFAGRRRALAARTLRAAAAQVAASPPRGSGSSPRARSPGC